MEKLSTVVNCAVRQLLQTPNINIEILTMTPDGRAKIKLTASIDYFDKQQSLFMFVESFLKEACPDVKGMDSVIEIWLTRLVNPVKMRT